MKKLHGDTTARPVNGIGDNPVLGTFFLRLEFAEVLPCAPCDIGSKSARDNQRHAAARAGNPKIEKFCNACFTGEYPTGDITVERLTALEEERVQNRGEVGCGAR